METFFVPPGLLTLVQEAWRASALDSGEQSSCHSRLGRDHCGAGRADALRAGAEPRRVGRAPAGGNRSRGRLPAREPGGRADRPGV